MTELHRCLAGHRCGDSETHTDPETGDKTTLGATLYQRGLCTICVSRADSVVATGLPLDMDDLDELLVPTGAQRLRDPDMPAQPHMRKAAPRLPLQEHPFALMELIVAETGFWAKSTADAAGVDWSVEAAARLPAREQVVQACQLLHYRIHEFVRLPTQRHPARSLKIRRAAGHDEDTTTRDTRDYWCHRDGPQGALVLVDLHRRALGIAGHLPSDRLGTPCPRCHRPLYREHHNNQVVCRYCDHRLSDTAYESFFEIAKATFGVTD